MSVYIYAQFSLYLWLSGPRQTTRVASAQSRAMMRERTGRPGRRGSRTAFLASSTGDAWSLFTSFAVMVGGFGNRTPLRDTSIPIQFRTWGMRDWMYEREGHDFTRFITICVVSVEVGARISRAEASARIRSILLRPHLDSRFASDTTISDILHRAGIIPDEEYVSFFPEHEHSLYRDVAA